MKRFVVAMTAVAGLGLIAILASQNGHAQGQSGFPPIGAQPSGSNQLPWLQSKSNPKGADAYYPTPGPRPANPEIYEGPDPNQDFLVTPALGPWLIFMTSYSTDRMTSDLQVKQMANQMVRELRSNYKLPAYVFNYGEEERRKENERAKQYEELQRKKLLDSGLSPDLPIRVPKMRIDIQCAVLVGGYKSDSAARRQLEHIRAIKVGHQELARFPAQYDMVLMNPTQGKGENAKINPFLKSHVVPNPTLRQGRQAEAEKLDIAALKRLNADESFSLLKCSKPWTLAVKQFLVPATVQPKEATTGTMLQKLVRGSNTGSGEEATALKGHKMAELLRAHKWEAYVLHTRHASIVTVGGYDGPDDGRLLRDQQALAEWNAKMPTAVQLFPRTMAMQVPR